MTMSDKDGGEAVIIVDKKKVMVVEERVIVR